MSEYPPNHYAERVWAGDHYHYPGIERLLARISTLEAENAKLAKLNAAYWAECEAWRLGYETWDGNPSPRAFMRRPHSQCEATDAARKEHGL